LINKDDSSDEEIEDEQYEEEEEDISATSEEYRTENQKRKVLPRMMTRPRMTNPMKTRVC